MPEDELAKAFARGVSQYVILGAGLDSFAYRRVDLRQPLHVYEVDHPAMQQWKRQRLAELNIVLPNNLTFIPIDFEVQTLAAGMAASPFKPHEPAFFSWLGVTQYLTTEAVLSTLQYVASSTAPGSEIVFQIILSPSTFSAEDQAVVTVASQLAAQRGEPWLSFFEPTTLEAPSVPWALPRYSTLHRQKPRPYIFRGGRMGCGCRITLHSSKPGLVRNRAVELTPSCQ